MREPSLGLWHLRREKLAQEAEMARLGRELRAARRSVSPRLGDHDRALAGRIGARIAAVLRLFGEKGTNFRLRSGKRYPSGCAS